MGRHERNAGVGETPALTNGLVLDDTRRHGSGQTLNLKVTGSIPKGPTTSRAVASRDRCQTTAVTANAGSPPEVRIRTPDQRLRVFVSSTLAELADEREAVSRAISALRLTPVMFELGARPHPPRDLYQAYLAQSDVFIGLYWQSYGRIAAGQEIS